MNCCTSGSPGAGTVAVISSVILAFNYSLTVSYTEG